MLGIEITLQSEKSNDTTLAQGCIFDDGQVYIHEPICDCFASLDDMKLNLTVEHFEVIGPVVPLERTKKSYKHTLDYINSVDLMKSLDTHKETNMHNLRPPAFREEAEL